MKKRNNENVNTTDELKSPNDKKIEDIKYWRNEHGKPSFKYLQTLANDGNPGSLEKLRSIAQDLDVNYGPNTSNDVLIRKILATQGDLNTTT